MARGPKKHLKRINTPKSWLLSKMGGIYATRPSQGPHKLRDCLPLSIILKYIIPYVETDSDLPSIPGKPTSSCKTRNMELRLITKLEEISNSQSESWMSSLLSRPMKTIDCSMISREGSASPRLKIMRPNTNC